MSEHTPISEENTPERQTPRFVDKLKDPSWKGFIEEVRETQHIISQYPPGDRRVFDTIDRYAGKLNEKFDWAHDDPLCKVTGFARGYDDSDDVGWKGEVFISTDRAIFKGIDILEFKGSWHVFFTICLDQPLDDVSSGTYYIPPYESHLAELQLSPDTTTATDRIRPEVLADLRTRFAHHADLSRDLVTSPAFINRHPAGQRVILLAAAAQLAGEIMREYSDCIVSINCKDYYVQHDEMPVYDLADTYTDIAGLPEEEQDNIVGVIERIGYPELDALPLDQPITLETLHINQGAACVIVYNEVRKRRYYIPEQSIISII